MATKSLSNANNDAQLKIKLRLPTKNSQEKEENSNIVNGTKSMPPVKKQKTTNNNSLNSPIIANSNGQSNPANLVKRQILPPNKNPVTLTKIYKFNKTHKPRGWDRQDGQCSLIGGYSLNISSWRPSIYDILMFLDGEKTFKNRNDQLIPLFAPTSAAATANKQSASSSAAKVPTNTEATSTALSDAPVAAPDPKTNTVTYTTANVTTLNDKGEPIMMNNKAVVSEGPPLGSIKTVILSDGSRRLICPGSIIGCLKNFADRCGLNRHKKKYHPELCTENRLRS